MLHVVNGESTLTTMRQVGLPGEACSWFDFLMEGPAPDGTEEGWRRRAEWLAGRYGLDAEGFLDAPTEHALFEHFASAAGEYARRSGAITVLVSHRFSTVRMADLILVIDGGRVAEQGSHDQLVRAGGLYAELYELQARAYR